MRCATVSFPHSTPSPMPVCPAPLPSDHPSPLPTPCKYSSPFLNTSRGVSRDGCHRKGLLGRRHALVVEAVGFAHPQWLISDSLCAVSRFQLAGNCCTCRPGWSRSPV